MPTTRRSDTVLFTYAINPLNTELTFKSISSANPLVPGVLIEYYNRRCTAQLCGELYNYELILVALDTGITPNPILLNDGSYPPGTAPQHVLCSLANPEPVVRRLVSDTADVSGLYRTGQDQVFGVLGRRLSTAFYPLVRHVTLLLYLGELIGVAQQPFRLAQQPPYGQLPSPP